MGLLFTNKLLLSILPHFKGFPAAGSASTSWENWVSKWKSRRIEFLKEEMSFSSERLVRRRGRDSISVRRSLQLRRERGLRERGGLRGVEGWGAQIKHLWSARLTWSPEKSLSRKNSSGKDGRSSRNSYKSKIVESNGPFCNSLVNPNTPDQLQDDPDHLQIKAVVLDRPLCKRPALPFDRCNQPSYLH